jgi:hypothetical protein
LPQTQTPGPAITVEERESSYSVGEDFGVMEGKLPPVSGCLTSRFIKEEGDPEPSTETGRNALPLPESTVSTTFGTPSKKIQLTLK